MFKNREDAARQLADRLGQRALRDPVVLAIPRGGVIIGAVLARALGAELDVVLARKLRAPAQPELAIGALGEDGRLYLDPLTRSASGATDEYLDRERAHQLQEITRRRKLYRSVRPPARLTGRTVILTDDGIATGSTMIAAIHVVKGQDPHEVIVAVPVAPPSHLPDFADRCDEIICLEAPATFWAIGQFYEDFHQVDDQSVAEALREFGPKAETAP